MNSRSWGSCSLWVFTYCHRAWIMTGLVWVWIPSMRASLGSSLNWGGWKKNNRNVRSGDFYWKMQHLHSTQKQHRQTGEYLPGNPAWATRCNVHPHRQVSSPGNRLSPEWWQSCATKVKWIFIFIIYMPQISSVKYVQTQSKWKNDSKLKWKEGKQNWSYFHEVIIWAI